MAETDLNASGKLKEAWDWCVKLVGGDGLNDASPTNPIPVTMAGTVATSGNVSVSNFPAVQPVSGSVAVGVAPTLPPVSISGVDAGGLKRHILTDANGVQVVSGYAAVGSAPASAPLSVAGVDAGGLKRHILTDATGVIQTSSPDMSASGTITTQNLNAFGAATIGSAVSLSGMKSVNTLTIQVTGSYTAPLSLQVTVDGTTWVTLSSTSTMLNVATGVSSPTITLGAVGIWQIEVAGFLGARITALGSGVSGSAVITLQASTATSSVAVNNALPAGTANIGIVNMKGSTGAILDTLTGVGAAPTNSLWVVPNPSSMTGVAPTVFNNAALTVANVKATAGNVYGFSCTNLASAQIFLQFYTNAGAPTLGTGVIWSLAIPVGQTLTIPPSTYPIWYTVTGIAIGASTTATGIGTPSTAPAVTVWYK